MTSPNKELDPYTAKAENDNLSPQEKIQGLHEIVRKVKTGMLTSRDSTGCMHSRAMAPSGRMFYVLYLALQRQYPYNFRSHFTHPGNARVYRKQGVA